MLGIESWGEKVRKSQRGATEGSLGGSKCEASQTSGGLLTFSVPKRCHFECDVYKPPSSNSSSSSAETKKT